LASDDNDKKRKESINRFQKMREDDKKQIQKELIKYNKLPEEITDTMIDKFFLYKEQDGHCVYCTTDLDLSIVLSNPHAYQIDHIIPESISHDTRKQNLVLVHQSCNHDKSNMTAYAYIVKNANSTKPNRITSYGAYEARLKDVVYKFDNVESRYFAEKISRLTDNTDFTKFSERQKFINRNLNDTRHAVKEVKSYLESVKNASYNIETTIGRETSYIRKNLLELEKNRDDYRHHAMDAIIIAYANELSNKFNQSYHFCNLEESENKKIIGPIKEELKLLKHEMENLSYNFSHLNEQKFNKKLFDDTLYSYKKNNGEFKEIVKVNLFETSPTTLSKIFNPAEDKEPEYIPLMKDNDPETFRYLCDI
jgi:CRISPR-associated endonuclease Csn1